MSEQLFMRQHSYEGFEAHENDHTELMERFLALKEQALSTVNSNQPELLLELRELLLTHISVPNRELLT